MENKAQQGFLLVTAVIIISIIGIFGAAMVYMFTGSATASLKELNSKQSFFIAESGLEYGLHQMIETGTSCSDIDTTHPNPIAFGDGEFQIQATLYNPSPAATLDGNINKNATTIPLSSSAGYSTTGGRVTINDEVIAYTSISGNSLIGARRAQAGTTSANHSNGDDVRQNQCNLTASGAVPTIAAATSEKQILADIQIPAASSTQSAWIVGNPDPHEALYEWNSTSVPDDWSRWGPSNNIYNNTDFYSVFAVTGDDVWAAGENGNIIHYDGTEWTFDQDIGSDDIRGLYCNAADDCWAVGENAASQGVFYHYNGTSWSFDSNAAVPLFSVACFDGSDCWAAGDDSIIYHYNGTAWSLNKDFSTNRFWDITLTTKPDVKPSKVAWRVVTN